MDTAPRSVSARVLFIKALDAEGLLTDDLAARLADLDDDTEIPALDDDTVPLLLAISDNGTEMTAHDTPVQGPVLDRPALRSALHADRPGLDRVAVGSRQAREPSPSTPSKTPPS